MPNASSTDRSPAVFAAGGASQKGYTLVEVLVALAVLLTGAVTIASVFSMNLRQNQVTMDRSTAAFAAQMKAEEIRRDNYFSPGLTAAIESLDTETQPAVFAPDSRFAYSFCGRTVLYRDLPESDPRAARGVARVIVRYSADFRPSQEVLYELRFK